MSKYIRLFIDINQDHFILPVSSTSRISELPRKIEDNYEREKNKRIHVDSLKVKGAILNTSIDDKIDHFLRDDDVIHTEFTEVHEKKTEHSAEDAKKKKSSEKSSDFYCDTCKRSFSSDSHLRRHLGSKLHKDLEQNK